MLQDLRFAIRSLRRHPTFTLVAVVTLALGLGANVAIFSVVDGVLLRTVPIDDLERLVIVWETDRDSGTTREPASLPDYLDFIERSRQVASFAALVGTQVTAGAADDAPVRLSGLRVTHTFLPLVGIEPMLGRGFADAETRPGGPRVSLISERLWTRRFDRDPDVIGRTLRLDEVPSTIIGVVPNEADFGILQILSSAAYARAFADRGGSADVDVWLPLVRDVEALPRSTHPLFVVGRLAPAATLASAEDELAAIAADLERVYPENDARGVSVEPLSSVIFGPVRAPLVVLLAAVGLVLIIACANVANLILARATTRLREVAVRQALGADVWRLGRQFCIESLLLVTLATGIGLATAALGLDLLLALAPRDIPRLAAVALDLRVVTVAVALASGVGLVFGVVPIVQAWRLDLQTGLKGQLRAEGALARGTRVPRRVFVVTQVALAVLLVVGAGLLARSFWRLAAVDSGFTTGGILKAEYELPLTRYPASFATFPDFPEVRAFHDRLLERVTAIPAVTGVAVAGNHPLDGGSTNSFVVRGREAEAADWPEITVRRVTPSYFDTVGLALFDGRRFDTRDDAEASPVAVINVRAAQRFFGDRTPLGEQLVFWGAERTIVGVVADERVHGPTAEAPFGVYLPVAQAPSLNGVYALLVRSTADPASIVPTVDRIMREIDPAIATFGVEPLDDTLARSVGQRRFVLTLLGLFAAVAIALAVVGLHGVLSYDVAQRTRELGIRMALGAREAGIVRLVMGEGLVLTGLGLALGIAAALLATRAMSALLFGVGPLDPLTYLAAAAGVALFALLASALPARRAAAVHPATALRVD